MINAPFIFSSAWKMAKAFVHPITAAKVHIIGSSEKEIRRTFDELGITLREGISLDALQTAKLDGWAAELAAARVPFDAALLGATDAVPSGLWRASYTAGAPSIAPAPRFGPPLSARPSLQL